MSCQCIKKVDIAVEFLDLAVQLYLKDKNYSSVIHLAGASEELLGKALESKGQNHILKEKSIEIIEGVKKIFGLKVEEKNACGEINRVKNEIKHWNNGEDMCADLEFSASVILQRAFKNYHSYFERQHNEHRNFVIKKTKNQSNGGFV
ncbi:hypothetical protein [Candidatus Thioglobus sp.]|uniref:hypothetical protein n=1 Tax=Candidatus Thioglobus sp. TaxID=2026721 RepID=UPI003D0B33EA